MDIGETGCADVRFYTESFAVKRDTKKEWTFDNMDLYSNPMRWTINIDDDNDHVTCGAYAHYFMTERARNWDVCLFPRRMVSFNMYRKSLQEKGPIASVLAGYTRFPFIGKLSFTDPWGNSIGFTGPNQPPDNWRGERVHYFDPA